MFKTPRDKLDDVPTYVHSGSRDKLDDVATFVQQ